MIRQNKIMVILMVLIMILSSCGRLNTDNSQLDKIVVEDDYNNQVIVEGKATKIVSLSPSTTEILFALGLDEEIVGVSDYCDYPEKALEKEKIGGFADANLERIIGLSPDIVISSGNENKEANEILRSANIKIAVFNSGTIDGVYSEIERIGQLTGREENAGRLIEEMKEKQTNIMEEVGQEKEKKKVFYEVWHDPLTAAGKGSFMDELIGLAGGENITGFMDKPYPEVSVETIIEGNPQIYLTTDGGVGKTLDSIKSRDGYANIDAVKNDRIYLLDSNIVSRPGPRIVDALEIVYEIISEE